MSDPFAQKPNFSDDLFAPDSKGGFLDPFPNIDGAVSADLDAVRDNLTGQTPKNCCPRPCPGNSSETCCTTCPNTCASVPESMDAVEMSPSSEFCSKTIMNWSQGQSCSPITRNEMQCVGSDGIFTSLPTIPGTF